MSPPNLKRLRPWSRPMVSLAVLAGSLMGSVAPAAEIILGYAEYENRIYVSPPAGGGNLQAGAVAVFSGSVGHYYAAGTPQDGQVRLPFIGFGQPVSGGVPIKPDVLLGQEIVCDAPSGPTGPPTAIEPAVKAFLAAGNKVFASEPGYVRITWPTGMGLYEQTVLVSSQPVKAPVSIFWTENTPAPRVDVSSLTVVPRHNSSVGIGDLWIEQDRVRARTSEGRIVLEYRNKSSGQFVGIEIVDLRAYQPGVPAPVDIGTWLAPVQPSLLKPYVARGSEVSYPYVYQHTVSGDPNDGKVMAVRPTSANDQIELFWLAAGVANIAWPYEMRRHTANWPADFASRAQRIYWTEDSVGIRTKAPLVDLRSIAEVTLYRIPGAFEPDQLWVSGGFLHAKTNTLGRILLHYNRSTLQFVEVLRDLPDQQSMTNVGVFLAPVKQAPTQRPYVAPVLTSDPMHFVYQHLFSGDPSDGKAFVARPAAASDVIDIFWTQVGSHSVVWPYEMHRYSADWPANFDSLARRIYHTESSDGTATRAPKVTIPALAVPTVTIHYNPTIPPNVSNNGLNSSLWVQTPRELNAKTYSGRVLMHYDNRPQGGFLGVEYVDVRPYNPDVVDAWHIGDRLLPSAGYPENLKPYVARGIAPDSPAYAYQHIAPPNTTSPMEGQVFATRLTTTASQIEIFWKRFGLAEVEWPYEMHRYTATWPTTVPSKYQRYVRAPSPVRGPTVQIPQAYQAVLEAFQTPGGHAILSGTTFSANLSAGQEGWSLLRYSPTYANSNHVRFQVVRSVQHDDAQFDLSLVPWDIGVEITDSYHQWKQGPGYLYVSPAEPHIWDRYDWEIYDGNTNDPPAFKTQQIFGVNQGPLEVWWYNTNLWHESVPWPSLVKRYTNTWPAQVQPLIISSQRGSQAIDPINQADYRIYYQNDPTRAGFNPNDEHALIRNNGDDQAVFALRDDLGTPGTSLPYALLKYRSPSADYSWRYSVLKVAGEGISWDGKAYTFTYPGTAGTVIQPPYPVSTIDVPPSPQNTNVSGPAWRDRKQTYWAKAAGDDRGPASVVMRYFYPVQDGFYFPSNYFTYLPSGVPQTNLPPAGSRVPWLDLQAGTPRVGRDITYQINWPTNLLVLRVGETLVKAKAGLPSIQGQTSVDVLYQQSVANGIGQSVKLIDPTRTVDVALAQLPSDIQVENDGALRYFPKLPPQLRSRLWYDSTSKRLRLKGQFVDTPAGVEEPVGYLLINVISQSESNRLVALSGDPTFKNAAKSLAAAAAQPIEVPANTVFDSLAVTAGLSKGQGFVTLAFANSSLLTTNNPAEPISLAIFKVECPIYRGELEVLLSENPLDEKLTLRHSGDFAGKPEDYVFEWRTLPPVDGLPPTVPWQQWNTFVPPSSGTGIVDITIEGPGLLTLSDNWFICRYRPKNNPTCLPGADSGDPVGWSQWTAPQLAEGWIKRAMAGINPFEQRFKDYKKTSVNTIVSMIGQAGARWIGNVPLNQQGMNKSGLIEIYETVFQRGMELSINGSPPVNYGPANDALLLAAGRLSDLYMLLGNEAYADAADPTIAFGTDDGQYGNVASSLHCFMNQTSSLLEEELKLLRGRDNRLLPAVQTYPFYNRLIWNFTGGMNGGVAAYSLNYNLTDTTGPQGVPDGVINEWDARAAFPQGHGDAWGQYLTAIKSYYRLLRNPNFTWVPRIEAVLVGGVPVSVDYLDERNFAKAAAARARTGAEIVNLTYRDFYTEDPSGQWKGYKDSDSSRAWGVSEWASRAGQAVLFDWAVGNALLPDIDPTLTDPDPANDHTGIQVIDRRTVTELGDIASAYYQIQSEMDNADLGLNPLGLEKNTIPFDIDPAAITQGKTHFEQILDRGVQAMNGAITVFDHANNATQLLRRQADTLVDFQQKVEEREVDFNSRLIEIFGYPYAEDIGPTGSYPSGYTGPDIDALHFNYIDTENISGVAPPTTSVVTRTLYKSTVSADGSLVTEAHPVDFNLSTEGLGFVKPAGWTQRRAPGEIQRALTELLQARVRLVKGLQDYDNLVNQIEDTMDLVERQYQVNADEIQILNEGRVTQDSLNKKILAMRGTQLGIRAAQRIAPLIADSVAECLPTAVGLATDVAAPARGALRMVGAVLSEVANASADGLSLAEMAEEQAKQDASAQNAIELTVNRQIIGIESQILQLRQLVRQEASSRYDLFSMREAVIQAAGNYQSTLARGVRLMDERLRFRAQTAAQIQGYRYKDMAFRIFRDEAIQKYRAQFDLAARYVYLTAKAYDYETCLLPDDPRGAGRDFLEKIVRCRAIGLVQGGQPIVGSGLGDPGLADPLARMHQNWNLVLKSQLNFINPETETGRFSLRSELFRVQTNATSSVARQVWRDILTRSVVSNLWDYPEFNKYCIYFSTDKLVAEPAIVIPFSTTITFGANYFGWPLGGGDSAYDPTHFATKVRSAGVWFVNYNGLAMSSTPRIYLFPVGSDLMRAPTRNLGQVREWNVVDQLLPVPYVNPTALNDPGWIPVNNMLGGTLAEIRRFASFRAYHDSGSFNPTETISSTRLVGRSVWNTRWVLIIPAGTLLQDRNEALQRFINGSLVNGVRDGNGISDIKIFFQTYSYAGN